MNNLYTPPLFAEHASALLSSVARVLRFRQRLVLTLAALLAYGISWGQAPERISYQSVVRDLSNNLITSQTVGVQITIRQGASNGANVYREQHSLMTNTGGLLSLEIGGGAVQNGSLSAINWNSGPYFVEQEIDPAGGTNYTLSQTEELLSVPYALHAKNASQANSASVADVATNITSLGQAGAPLGMITSYTGTAGNIPQGWLLCDGAAYDVNAYPELFALIGTTYGSAPNRFRVPDLRGRSPVGRDVNEPAFEVLGKTGGEKTHTLTIDEMPAHNHGGVTGSAGSHRHEYGTRGFLIDVAATVEQTEKGMDGSTDDTDIQTRFEEDHTHGINNAGQDNPHNNLQPYLTINFIIKAN